MKVLVDTNVWLDVILHRQPFEIWSKGMLMACLNEDVEIHIVGTSLKDIFYITEKVHDSTIAYQAVELLLSLATVSSVDAVVCKQALELEKSDYEDGIIAAAAHADKVDAVVTRDKNAFEKLSIPRFAPKAFIEHLGYEEIAFDE